MNKNTYKFHENEESIPANRQYIADIQDSQYQYNCKTGNTAGFMTQKNSSDGELVKTQGKLIFCLNSTEKL